MAESAGSTQAPNGGKSLLDLPTEVLHQILEQVTSFQIGPFRLVSKRCKQLGGKVFYSEVYASSGPRGVRMLRQLLASRHAADLRRLNFLGPHPNMRSVSPPSAWTPETGGWSYIDGHGPSTRMYHVDRLNPLDEAMVEAALRRTSALTSLEFHHIDGADQPQFGALDPMWNRLLAVVPLPRLQYLSITVTYHSRLAVQGAPGSGGGDNSTPKGIPASLLEGLQELHLKVNGPGQYEGLSSLQPAPRVLSIITAATNLRVLHLRGGGDVYESFWTEAWILPAGLVASPRLRELHVGLCSVTSAFFTSVVAICGASLELVEMSHLWMVPAGGAGAGAGSSSSNNTWAAALEAFARPDACPRLTRWECERFAYSRDHARYRNDEFPMLDEHVELEDINVPRLWTASFEDRHAYGDLIRATNVRRAAHALPPYEPRGALVNDWWLCLRFAPLADVRAGRRKLGEYDPE